MLGKLVNKFKRQTLQDGVASPPPLLVSAQLLAQPSPPAHQSANSGHTAAAAGGTRRSARLNEKAEKERAVSNHQLQQNQQQTVLLDGCESGSPSPPNTRARRAAAQTQFSSSGLHHQSSQLCDSGTESDDDELELEMLDSLSNASRALEDGIGSPPTLTSSPPLISEIDTSSWDSCGCESGIVLRDSAERDDASRNVDLLEAAIGGGELVLVPPGHHRKEGSSGGGTDTAGTTPVQSKDAFPSHFRQSGCAGGAHPMPIDFSALRHSELLFSAASANNTCGLLGEDMPTPIGSQKALGQGAVLMELAVHQQQLGRAQPTAQQQQQEPAHQGAFRRVLRRTRRNSNSQQTTTNNASANANSSTTTVTAAAVARTVSPLGIGLGEKRRWDSPPVEEQQEPQQQTTATTAGTPTIAEASGTATETPIAMRTRGSLMGSLIGGGAAGGGAEAELPRPVLTAARRTRVRVLYSAQDQPQHNKGTGGIFLVPQQVHGRRGQVAPMLGQSPPSIMVVNKRGRHSSKSSGSPPRPSLNFDKMRKRMMSNNSSGGGACGPSATGSTNGAAGEESRLD